MLAGIAFGEGPLTNTLSLGWAASTKDQNGASAKAETKANRRGCGAGRVRERPLTRCSPLYASLLIKAALRQQL